jgi:two-component sensor histidine kinase
MQQHKENESTNIIEILILVFIWLVVFASPVIVWNGNGGINWGTVFSTWIRLLPFLILSILNHFILVPFVFFRKRKWYFAIAIVILMLFPFLNQRIQDKRFDFGKPPGDWQMIRDIPPDKPGIGDRNKFSPPLELPMKREKNKPGSLPPYLNYFILALLILGFDTGMRSIFKGSKIEQEKEILEKEKVKSELAFLRNQISPHFFMNTLNNIHSLIDLDTQGAKDAIIRLSKLMQHLLYDSEKERIQLKEEIAFIQSYIELMKLRLNEKVKVSVDIQFDETAIMIPPLLFTSLLENAFKYGVSYKEKSFIDISLVTHKSKVVFKISNSIIAGKKQFGEPTNSGIGLENTRKRLDLLYANRYKMNVSNSDGIFSVTLILPI